MREKRREELRRTKTDSARVYSRKRERETRREEKKKYRRVRRQYSDKAALKYCRESESESERA